MQKVALNERMTTITLRDRISLARHLEPTDTTRDFPKINELQYPTRESAYAFTEQETQSQDNEAALPDEFASSVWVPEEKAAIKQTENIELKQDQQVVIDDIAKTIALAQTNAKESKATLNLSIGGELVIVQIVKRKNRTKVQFTSENSSVRRLLRNTKVELKEAATKAGVNLHRIDVR